MPGYINKDALLAEYKGMLCSDCEEMTRYGDCCCDLPTVIRLLERAPTVDAVEVVRCKYCKYGKILDGVLVKCSFWHYHPIDYFCADGERREEDAKTN